MQRNRNIRVIVAMSGGVDSSVVAALLKKQGYDVAGVFMRFWLAPRSLGEGGKDINRCCSVDSEKLARAVAKKIGIPFYVINVEKEFKKQVVDYFLAEYKKGNTPNPCIVCNKEIKFGLLIKKALLLGADFIATGHYARLQRETPNPKPQIPNKIKIPNSKPVKFFKSVDEEKDQSYFLWQLSQKQLSRVLFPVGGHTKPEVRKLAKKFNLPTAQTPESQEVCFVNTNLNEFLKSRIKTNKGKIINTAGKVLAEHQGLWFYTIGQRKGIGLSGGPYYVVGKDFKKNILIVSKNEKDLEKKEFIAKDVNWISGKEPRLRQGSGGQAKLPLKVLVKIRYKADLSNALIRSNKGGRVKVVFDKPQKAITPGQSAVFYLGEELLGGGVIE